MKIKILLILLLYSFAQPIPTFANAIPVERTTPIPKIQHKKQIKTSKKSPPITSSIKDNSLRMFALIILISTVSKNFF